jgi:hypothetical protein
MHSTWQQRIGGLLPPILIKQFRNKAQSGGKNRSTRSLGCSIAIKVDHEGSGLQDGLRSNKWEIIGSAKPALPNRFLDGHVNPDKAH